MAQKFNYFLTRGCDLLLAPFAKLPPFWGILFLSLLTSLFVLVVYRAVSSPKKVKDTKNQIKAHILAIRLYRDFWKIIVVSFFKSLYYTGKYFVLNLFPLLLVLPLMFLLFVQMDIRYGMRPFRVGERHHGQGRVQPGHRRAGRRAAGRPPFPGPDEPGVHPRPARGRLETAGRPERRRAPSPSASTGPRSVKTWLSATSVPALSNKKMAASGWEHFIYPAEKLLAPAPALKYISLQYPARSIGFPGPARSLACLLPCPDHDHRPGPEKKVRRRVLILFSLTLPFREPHSIAAENSLFD